MREVATTLTDYLLVGLCAAAAVGLLRRPTPSAGIGPILFFCGASLSLFFAGTWHGFFSAPNAPGSDFVWWLSMALGILIATGLAVTGIEFLGYTNRTVLLVATAVILAAFSVYCWHDQRFIPNLIASALGTILCATGLVRQWTLGAKGPIWMVLASLGISVAAAVAQQARIEIHPEHFDHNATYHLFLLPALGLFYYGLRGIVPSARKGDSKP